MGLGWLAIYKKYPSLLNKSLRSVTVMAITLVKYPGSVVCKVFLTFSQILCNKLLPIDGSIKDRCHIANLKEMRADTIIIKRKYLNR
jgi:hypothetical protein